MRGVWAKFAAVVKPHRDTRGGCQGRGSPPRLPSHNASFWRNVLKMMIALVSGAMRPAHTEDAMTVTLEGFSLDSHPAGRSSASLASLDRSLRLRLLRLKLENVPRLARERLANRIES